MKGVDVAHAHVLQRGVVGENLRERVADVVLERVRELHHDRCHDGDDDGVLVAREVLAHLGHHRLGFGSLGHRPSQRGVDGRELIADVRRGVRGGGAEILNLANHALTRDALGDELAGDSGDEQVDDGIDDKVVGGANRVGEHRLVPEEGHLGSHGFSGDGLGELLDGGELGAAAAVSQVDLIGVKVSLGAHLARDFVKVRGIGHAKDGKGELDALLAAGRVLGHGAEASRLVVLLDNQRGLQLLAQRRAVLLGQRHGVGRGALHMHAQDADVRGDRVADVVLVHLVGGHLREDEPADEQPPGLHEAHVVGSDELGDVGVCANLVDDGALDHVLEVGAGGGRVHGRLDGDVNLVRALAELSLGVLVVGGLLSVGRRLLSVGRRLLSRLGDLLNPLGELLEVLLSILERLGARLRVNLVGQRVNLVGGVRAPDGVGGGVADRPRRGRVRRGADSEHLRLHRLVREIDSLTRLGESGLGRRQRLRRVLDGLDGILQLHVRATELLLILRSLRQLGSLLRPLELRAGVRKLERSVLHCRLRGVELVDGVEQFLTGGGEPREIGGGVVSKFLELSRGFGVSRLGGVGAASRVARSLARGLHGSLGHLGVGNLVLGELGEVLLALAHAFGEVLGASAKFNLLRSQQLVLGPGLVEGLGGGVELASERGGFEMRLGELVRRLGELVGRLGELVGRFLFRRFASSELLREPSAGVLRLGLGVGGVALRGLEGEPQRLLHRGGLGLAAVVLGLGGGFRSDELIRSRLRLFEPAPQRLDGVALRRSLGVDALKGLGAALLAAGLVRGGDGVNRRFHRELGGSREFARALILLRDCLLRLGERGVEALELGFGLLGNLALGVGVVAKGVGLAAGLRDPRGGADLPSLDLSLEHPRGAAFLDARGGEDVVVSLDAGLSDARAGLVGDASVMPRDLMLGVGGGVASLDARARRRGRAGRARPARGRVGRGGRATIGVGRDVVAALLARRGDARSRVDVAMGAAGGAADVLGPLLHGVSVGDCERRGRRGRDEQQHQVPRPRPSGRAGARHRARRARGIDERPRSPLSK